MSALIVDDDTTMLRLLRAVLKQIDIYDVEEATDGLEALARLRSRPFDIVISDWHMRPMNGFELLHRVRQDPDLPRLRFVMLTAECAPDRVEAAKQAGVSRYIVKPFRADMLQEHTRAVCAHD